MDALTISNSGFEFMVLHNLKLKQLKKMKREKKTYGCWMKSTDHVAGWKWCVIQVSQDIKSWAMHDACRIFVQSQIAKWTQRCRPYLLITQTMQSVVNKSPSPCFCSSTHLHSRHGWKHFLLLMHMCYFSRTTGTFTKVSCLWFNNIVIWLKRAISTFAAGRGKKGRRVHFWLQHKMGAVSQY